MDVVRAEFEKLIARPSRPTSGPPRPWTLTLRTNFADGDGRLPRTLEKFLGDRGALRGVRRRAVRRVEAGQRHRPDADGCSARTSTATRRSSPILLDPTRLRLAAAPVPASRSRTASTGSKERLVAIEAAAAARAAERADPRPRAPTSRTCSRRCSATSRAAPATCSTGPATEAGTVLKSKKGDFVLTVDARAARGARTCGSSSRQGPRRCPMPGDPRGASRGQEEPRRGRRGGRLHAQPRAHRHRPVRRPRRRTSTASSIPEAPEPANLEAADPAGPPPGARLARRARGRGRRGRHPRGAHRRSASSSRWSAALKAKLTSIVDGAPRPSGPG